MSRIASRVAKLEQTLAERSTPPRWHRVWDKPDMSDDDYLSALIAAGRAGLGDRILRPVFYRPGPNGPERVFLPEPAGWQ